MFRTSSLGRLAKLPGFWLSAMIIMDCWIVEFCGGGCDDENHYSTKHSMIYLCDSVKPRHSGDAMPLNHDGES